MKKIIILLLLTTCLQVFSQEKVTKIKTIEYMDYNYNYNITSMVHYRGYTGFKVGWVYFLSKDWKKSLEGNNRSYDFFVFADKSGCTLRKMKPLLCVTNYDPLTGLIQYVIIDYSAQIDMLKDFVFTFERKYLISY